jgi:iron(III) transport system ATP-binding protein
VYVTHDQVEALAMSNVIAVMRAGVIEQLGKPRDVYERPSSRFVADFIGTSNFIDGVVDSREGDVYAVSTAEGVLRATSTLELSSGSAVVISIRPEHVVLKAHDPSSESAANTWRGKVQTRAFLGESVDHVVTVGKIEMRARSNPTLSIRPETDVTLTLPVERCALIPNAE